MIEAPEVTSTRPYLIRALYEWCTDNGFTPYVAVSINDNVQVPREYAKDGEIVLNISFDATSSLVLGNDFIEFKGRFAGTAREILIPVGQVIAIYAKENGQGMAFPLEADKSGKSLSGLSKAMESVQDAATSTPEVRQVQLTTVSSKSRAGDSSGDPELPRTPPAGPRPVLKRIK